MEIHSDKKLSIIKKLREENELFLFKKYKELQESCKTNDELIDVVKEYSDYYNNIKKQKLDQQTALENLLKYLSNASRLLCETEDSLRRNRIYKKQIEEEIKRIQREIKKY
jgi:hypothetical protein